VIKAEREVQMETLNTLAAVVVVALIAVAAWFYRRKQSPKLQEHFGPEYELLEVREPRQEIVAEKRVAVR
jgi:hypothetical protein